MEKEEKNTMSEKKWVDARFGDSWKDNAKKHYSNDMIIDLAFEQGRKAIQLEKERDELKEENVKLNKGIAAMSATIKGLDKKSGEVIQILRQELQALKGLHDPWPLKDILKKLIESANILLNKKDYDGHDWEEIKLAIGVAEDKLKSLIK